MNLSDLNWGKWLTQGAQYLKAATPKTGKSRFGTDIMYNLLSLSLESYVMAILDFHHSLPENHTYTDLITGLESVMPLDPVLKEKILNYESIQSICSIDKYERTSPSEESINDLRCAIVEIGRMAEFTCIAK